jgi:hypothetical protein
MSESLLTGVEHRWHGVPHLELQALLAHERWTLGRLMGRGAKGNDLG